MEGRNVFQDPLLLLRGMPFQFLGLLSAPGEGALESQGSIFSPGSSPAYLEIQLLQGGKAFPVSTHETSSRMVYRGLRVVC